MSGVHETPQRGSWNRGLSYAVAEKERRGGRARARTKCSHTRRGKAFRGSGWWHSIEEREIEEERRRSEDVRARRNTSGEEACGNVERVK